MEIQIGTNMQEETSPLDRKYQVFISSTFNDLKRHRQAASGKDTKFSIP